MNRLIVLIAGTVAVCIYQTNYPAYLPALDKSAIKAAVFAQNTQETMRKESVPLLTLEQAMEYAQSIMPPKANEKDSLKALEEIEKLLIEPQKKLVALKIPCITHAMVEYEVHTLRCSIKTIASIDQMFEDTNRSICLKHAFNSACQEIPKSADKYVTSKLLEPLETELRALQVKKQSLTLSIFEIKRTVLQELKKLLSHRDQKIPQAFVKDVLALINPPIIY